MLIIGLTGGIGSGKSAASQVFESFDIHVVDADIVARRIVEPGTEALLAITDHFGQTVISNDGTLNRAELRQIIFSSEKEKAWLENLLHPTIRSEIQRQLKSATSEYAILVSPLLFETDQHKLVSRTLLIDLPVHMQLERASTRDKNSREQIQKIIDTQLSRDVKLRLTDDIIENDSDLESLKQRIEAQHQKYLELAREQ